MNESNGARIAPALGALLLLALVGCTPSGPSVSPGTSASASAPSATASATAAPAAASVILGSRVADIVAADSSVIGRIDFFGPTESAVELLTAAFGEAPTVTPYAAGIESPAGTDYAWGGFVLRDPEPVGSAPLDPEFVAQVRAPSVGDVVVAGPGGVRVGDSVAELAAEWADEPAVRIGDSSFSFDIVEVGAPAAEGEQGKELSLLAVAADGGPMITLLWTPVQNWGV